MRLFSTYSVKIKHYNRIFRETVTLYRNSVDFLIKVCLDGWDTIANISQNQLRQQYVERLCHQTKKNRLSNIPHSTGNSISFQVTCGEVPSMKQSGKYLLTRVTLLIGKRQTLTAAEINLLFQWQDISIRPCTRRLCTNRPAITR